MSNIPLRIDKKNNQSGFSLVELVIVVALIAIFMSIAVPRFTMSSHRELDLATRELVSNLRLIRSETIATGIECRITYNLAEKSYEVKLVDGGYTVYLPEEITTFSMNKMDTLDDKKNPYNYFTSTGSPNVSRTITLWTEDGKERKISIIMATGRVKIVP